MKIKFNSDDKLPLNKMIEILSMIIVVRAVFMKITNIIDKSSQINICINYRRERNKNIICKTKSFYNLLAFLLVTIASLIAIRIYCYLIKYEAKQKHLLPFYVTNNKFKKIVLIKINYENGK